MDRQSKSCGDSLGGQAADVGQDGREPNRNRTEPVRANLKFPSFCEIGTGSSPGVGGPPSHSVLVNSTVLPSVVPPRPFSTSTVTVGPAAQNPFKSRPNHQNNIKSQRRSKRKGLGQGAEPRVGSRVPPQALGRGPPPSGCRTQGKEECGGRMALGQGPEVGPLAQPLAQPLGPILFSLIFVGF